MNILVTGGAGYIGSHTCVELLNSGYDVTVIDNLCNANPKSLKRVEAITGRKVKVYEGDVRDEALLRKIFAENEISAVIHFAGLKAVGESVHKPIEYYDNNVGGTVKLLEAMRDAGCKNIIFSSSATVYGTPEKLPLTEDMPKGEVTNPYGRTKSIIEDILTDVQFAYPDMNVVLLRYFNPIGAHKSGTMGEDPTGIPNNLMPYITQVAVGKLDKLGVFGDDYDTPDGTCLRDYIDVVDLAKAHVAAVDRMTQRRMKEAYEIFNIGTGTPVSVLELVKGFERANGLTLNYKIVGRRAGDVKAVWADTQRANKELGWKAERPLEETLRSAWAWEKHVRGIE